MRDLRLAFDCGFDIAQGNKSVVGFFGELSRVLGLVNGRLRAKVVENVQRPFVERTDRLVNRRSLCFPGFPPPRKDGITRGNDVGVVGDGVGIFDVFDIFLGDALGFKRWQIEG